MKAERVYQILFGVLILCGLYFFRVISDLPGTIDDRISNAFAKTYHPSKNVIGPYTPAVQVGAILFVSGQIGMDPATGQFPGNDIESQTKQAFTNLFAVLNEAGFDSSDVVQCTVYLKDMKEFQRMNLIYGGYFAEDSYPTRATVEVANLPRDAKVEIAATALKSKTITRDRKDEK
jgi:2-iminobutanoate/2-iminopropanoate deaminase